ncbi:hypothetical protein TNCV_1988571 [Trichonephila clavipes]|nr:hypothetical protein TNCV_1988571 [Trichonephila clavipes]
MPFEDYELVPESKCLKNDKICNIFPYSDVRVAQFQIDATTIFFHCFTINPKKHITYGTTTRTTIKSDDKVTYSNRLNKKGTATAGSDVVQSGRPIFDDFFQHLWPYIGNNMANVVFQMVKRLWLIRIDQ